MSVEERISQFFNYFAKQSAYVDSLRGSEHIDVDTSDPEKRPALHKKILYSAMLDALAANLYAGENLRNRERFLRLLREHSAWSSGELISTVVLAERLGPSESQLRRHLECILGKYDTGSGNSLPLTTFDVSAASLECLASEDEQAEIPKCSHWELFYRYRNYIVHEFREPGYAMECFAEGEEPCYHGYSNDSKWHLLYPEEFFGALLRRVLASLEAHYSTRGRDPYEAVEDSSAW